MPAATHDQILNEEAFCARFCVARRTAARWRQQGIGPAWVRLGPRRIGYAQSACDAWAAANTHKSRAAELAAQIGR